MTQATHIRRDQFKLVFAATNLALLACGIGYLLYVGRCLQLVWGWFAVPFGAPEIALIWWTFPIAPVLLFASLNASRVLIGPIKDKGGHGLGRFLFAPGALTAVAYLIKIGASA